MVRQGQTVLVVDRNVPVARIEPVNGAEGSDEDRLRPLLEGGVVAPARCRLDVGAFLAEDMPETETGTSAVNAVLQDREEGL